MQIVLWYLLHWVDLSASAADVVTVLAWIVGIIAGVFIVLTGVYCGFAMSYCKSVPFWNTGLLPIVFVIMGVADGLALTMGVGPGRPARSVIGTARVWYPHPAHRQRPADRRLPGQRALPVGLDGRAGGAGPHQGQHGLGLLDPHRDPGHRHPPGHLVRRPSFIGGTPTALLIFAIVCHTIGAFALKYWRPESRHLPVRSSPRSPPTRAAQACQERRH